MKARLLRNVLSWGLVAAGAWGCGGDKSAAPASSAPVAASAAPIASTPAASGVSAAPTASAAPTVAPAPSASAAPAAPGVYPAGAALAGRSNVPTVAEWNGQTKEVAVKGSSALQCETKMVREWLRVSCRGKNDTGGTPTGVKVTQGDGEGVYAFFAGGVASLIVPFVEGTSVTATFSWTDKSHRLSITWPKGKPTPPILGVFDGASSPLDFPPAPLVPGELACECDIAINGSSMCLPSSWLGDVAACEKKHVGNCRAMIACADEIKH